MIIKKKPRGLRPLGFLFIVYVRIKGDPGTRQLRGCLRQPVDLSSNDATSLAFTTVRIHSTTSFLLGPPRFARSARAGHLTSL